MFLWLSDNPSLYPSLKHGRGFSLSLIIGVRSIREFDHLGQSIEVILKEKYRSVQYRYRHCHAAHTIYSDHHTVGNCRIAVCQKARAGNYPHITLTAAMYQVRRVAEARNISPDKLGILLKEHSFTPGLIFTREPLVNVLLVNQAMDIASEANTPYNRIKF